MGIDLRQKTKARLDRETSSVSVNAGASVRFALAFPNIYSLGMASLGFQLVYQMLNELPKSCCERVFLPDPPDLKEHERTSTELFTLETQTPLAEFDVIAFSIPFELDYVNVLRMLRLSNLPIRSIERDERHPIVIAGGPCATFNPEPLADFVDAFVIGEAEPVLPLLVETLETNLGASRDDVLAALSQLPSVYVPRFYRPAYDSDGLLLRVDVLPPAPSKVKRAIAHDLSVGPSSSAIKTPEAEFGEIELVETARGCGWRCRFCLAGHITRPPRPRELPRVKSKQRIGLVGAAVFDHPQAVDMCRSIVDVGNEFTVSSVRLETITREIAELMSKGGQKTLTIAPEAGTQRLRRVINKAATDDELFAAVSTARDAGIARVKLYYMIGLPTETDEDSDAIADLSLRLVREFPSVAFQVSVSCFVPKPWTPFQWHPMEREDVLKKRYASLQKRLSGIRNLKFSGESPRLALVQGLLARGDRMVGRLVADALEQGGYGRAIRNVDLSYYLHRPREREELLPWDHIDMGIYKDYLWREYRKGLDEVTTGRCNVGRCRECGACE